MPYMLQQAAGNRDPLQWQRGDAPKNIKKRYGLHQPGGSQGIPGERALYAGLHAAQDGGSGKIRGKQAGAERHHRVPGQGGGSPGGHHHPAGRGSLRGSGGETPLAFQRNRPAPPRIAGGALVALRECQRGHCGYLERRAKAPGVPPPFASRACLDRARGREAYLGLRDGSIPWPAA